METLYPLVSYTWNSNWSTQQMQSCQSKNTEWSKEENKRFESALAMIDEKTPDRWSKVAAMTGKSVSDVISQYMALEADVIHIESGLVPVPGYLASSFTLGLRENGGCDGYRKRGRSCDQERKKGVPWTEEEHRRFLMGLLKYGKGDWRNISRNFVISKTPTQVASHAQKYFLRQQLGGGGGGKDKRRPSIHDITTVHVGDTNQGDTKPSSSLENSSMSNDPVRKSTATPKTVVEWNESSDDALLEFDSAHSNRTMAYPSDVSGLWRYGWR